MSENSGASHTQKLMSVRLLLSTQRSGSQFLKALIESRFSSVLCSGEVLEESVAFADQFLAIANWDEVPPALRGTDHGWMGQSPLLASA
jgi:hypothetical protein